MHDANKTKVTENVLLAVRFRLILFVVDFPLLEDLVRETVMLFLSVDFKGFNNMPILKDLNIIQYRKTAKKSAIPHLRVRCYACA